MKIIIASEQKPTILNGETYTEYYLTSNQDAPGYYIEEADIASLGGFEENAVVATKTIYNNCTDEEFEVWNDNQAKQIVKKYY